MGRVREEQRGNELRKDLQEVLMGSNEAAADSSYLTLFIARSRDPNSTKLTQR